MMLFSFAFALNVWGWSKQYMPESDKLRVLNTNNYVPMYWFPFLLFPYISGWLSNTMHDLLSAVFHILFI